MLVITIWHNTADADTPGESIDEKLLELLVFSQVVLSFQLPFAIVPLLHFTSDRRAMGAFASAGWLKILGWLCAILVIGLNVVLIGMQTDSWADSAGENAAWVYAGAGIVAAALALFLVWVTIYPILQLRKRSLELATLGRAEPLPLLPEIRYPTHWRGRRVRRRGCSRPFPGRGAGPRQGAELVAVHIVEGMGAIIHGPETHDLESRSDRSRMAEARRTPRADGLQAEGVLGFGTPPEELVRIARERKFDLMVLGTHGHRFFADMALGRTVSPVLHRLKIPVLVVPTRVKSEI